MYGLPNDSNLTFLKGAELLQLCVGCHELIANFHGDISITIQCSFLHRAAGESRGSPVDLPLAAAGLLSLVGHSVMNEVHDTTGRLELTFSNSEVLTLFDDSKEHESYTISCGEKLIVV